MWIRAFLNGSASLKQVHEARERAQDVRAA
jgi:hypothetical protein